MSLIKLTTRPNKGAPKDVRPVLVGVSQIVSVEPYQPSDPAKGSKVTVAVGKAFEVSETVDEVLELAHFAQAGPDAEHLLEARRRSRALDKKMTEGVPTDRPDSLHPRPHAAPVYGESHPAAHAAEQLRRETGDPLANEDVPRKEGAPKEGDPLPGHLGRQVTTPGTASAKLTEAAEAKKGDDVRTDAAKAQEAATSSRPFHPAEAVEGVTKKQDEAKPTPPAVPPVPPKKGGGK